MSVGQATTPTFICTVPDSIDLTAADAVYFTLSQNGRKVTKTGGDITVAEHSVSAYLNQRDTVWLRPGQPIELQVNWTYEDGRRGMTNIVSVTVDRNLVPEVLT